MQKFEHSKKPAKVNGKVPKPLPAKTAHVDAKSKLGTNRTAQIQGTGKRGK